MPKNKRKQRQEPRQDHGRGFVDRISRWSSDSPWGKLVVWVVAPLTIIAMVVGGGSTIIGRGAAKERSAWSVINEGQGKGGDGGKRGALELLNERHRSLARLDLSNSELSGVRLPKANLTESLLADANLLRADLRGAVLKDGSLWNADLRAAQLDSANLDRVDLRRANLQRASVTYAWLRLANLAHAHGAAAQLVGSYLFDANLEHVNLWQADLRDAALQEANLSNALLLEARLNGARLAGADLRGANITGAEGWRDIECLDLANIHGVTGAPAGFFAWAIDTMGAVSIAGDDDWLAAKRRRLADVALTAQESSQGISFKVGPNAERGYRTPILLGTQKYMWVKGFRPPLDFMSVDDDAFVADCLTPNPRRTGTRLSHKPSTWIY